MHCNATTWNFITSGKSHARTGNGGPSKQQRVVSKRRNTVVGGKCALQSALLVVTTITCKSFNPLIATLKPQNNGLSYSNTMIATLTVDGWAVSFGTARRGLGGAAARPGPSSLYQM